VNTVRASDPDDPTRLLEEVPAELRDGACAKPGVDPAVFFPRKSHQEDARKAKEICATCPVIDTCRSYGLRTQRFGVWGGMTGAMRSKYRAANGIPTPAGPGDTK